jgi:hypothetical protein
MSSGGNELLWMMAFRKPKSIGFSVWLISGAWDTTQIQPKNTTRKTISDNNKCNHSAFTKLTISNLWALNAITARTASTNVTQIIVV